MTLKPCIQCRKDCEIMPVQLGDFFTLTYLRVCSPECMFLEAYDFMYSIGEHKHFRNHLYNLQNEEDNKERSAFMEKVTKEAMKNMAEDLKANPNMLSAPVSNSVLEMFASKPNFPSVGATMTFTRPSRANKIKWQTEHVESLRKKLAEAENDLEYLLVE